MKLFLFTGILTAFITMACVEEGPPTLPTYPSLFLAFKAFVTDVVTMMYAVWFALYVLHVLTALINDKGLRLRTRIGLGALTFLTETGTLSEQNYFISLFAKEE